MTPAKVISVLAHYRDLLSERYPDYPFERMDVSKPYVQVSQREAWGHMKWACTEAMQFAAHGRMDKAFRWLGFIQGVLFRDGFFSIDELGNHSRPDSDETKP